MSFRVGLSYNNICKIFRFMPHLNDSQCIFFGLKCRSIMFKRMCLFYFLILGKENFHWNSYAVIKWKSSLMTPYKYLIGFNAHTPWSAPSRKYCLVDYIKCYKICWVQMECKQCLKRGYFLRIYMHEFWPRC